LTVEALRFVDVSCRFGTESVVNKVSFDIAQGEIVCLLGPSGCGKTTSLRLAGGMETLSSGEIWLQGECVATAHYASAPETRRIGFLFQDFALFPHLTVAENISFGIGHLTKREKRARVAMLLEAVGLEGFDDKFPDTLSGGEQQRAALARALAPEPKLVLMDEPFSSLDPQLRDQMRDLTLRLLKQSDAAGLIVTHDAADALRMADRIAVQNQGRLIQLATPEEIYAAPETLDVATMFGPINLMPGEVINHQLTCINKNVPMTAENGAYQVGVRPENIELSSATQSGDEQMVFEAEIVSIRAIGPDYLCDLMAPGLDQWQARLRCATRPETGTQEFCISARHLMLFKS